MLALGVMTTGPVWKRRPGDGRVLGLDITELTHRLSVHPPDLSAQILRLCLIAEPHGVRAIHETQPEAPS